MPPAKGKRLNELQMFLTICAKTRTSKSIKIKYVEQIINDLIYIKQILSMIRKSYLKTHTLAVGSKQIKMKYNHNRIF